MEQPTNPRKLGKHEVRRLESLGLLDTHDGVTKYAGSRQDIYLDKDTGELWVARKHSAQYYEQLGVNPKARGIPGF